mgnify:CR=1 FL=1
MTASADGLVVTAYQRTNEGDATSADTFADYTAIDTITLTQSLSEKFGAQPEAAVTAAEPAEETSAFPWWILAVAGGAVAVVLIVVVVVVSQKQRKEKAAK